jgi:hypothetical protein
MLNSAEGGNFFSKAKDFLIPNMLVSISEKAKNEGAYAC